MKALHEDTWRCSGTEDEAGKAAFGTFADIKLLQSDKSG